MQHAQPTHFTPFTPAVRTQSQGPGQYGAGLTVRGDDQPFNGQKSSRICRHYQRGRCTWGEHCRFLHEGAVMTKEDRYGPGGYGPQGDMGGGFMVSSGGMGGMGGYGMNPQMPSDAASRNLLLGLNQSRLQAMRHAKLITALKGNYDIQPTETPGQVQIISPGLEPDIVTFLTQDQVQQALAKLDEDERFKEAGLLMYVVGEPSVFYSAVRLFVNNGSCGHSRLDLALQAASSQGLVECMFYRSAAGCQAPKCSYEHRPLAQLLSNPSGYPANTSPSLGSQGMPAFTAQQQRFTATTQSLGPSAAAPNWKPGQGFREGGLPPAEAGRYGQSSHGSDLGQWDHLEKVVDSLKAEEEGTNPAWNGGGGGAGGFFAVGGAGNDSAGGSIW